MWWTDLSPRARGLGLILLSAGALSACAGGGDKPNVAITPTEQFPITVQETPDRVAFNPHPEGLSMMQRTALVGLVNRWRGSPDAGDFAVQTPAGADPAASRTSSELIDGLYAMGVPRDRIRIGDYDAPAGSPILASYNRLEAQVHDCRGHWNNLTSTGSNRPMDHLGCAVASNFAAQVADPRDFLEPAPVTASDAARREVVLGKYRAGEITSTPRDPQAVGAISGAVGSK